MGSTEKQLWPSWRYGPNGEAQIFQNAGDVPKGWEDHPSKVKTEEGPTLRQRVDTNLDHYKSIRELQEAYAAGKVTLDEIEAAEQEREKPRDSLVAWLERQRRQQASEDGEGGEGTEIVTREEALAELREAGVEIADDASDEEIEAALATLSG